ncbi:hypothetical protein CE91St50_06750 [Clostridioides difficile]|nr:hypothetical protein CE91St50_06750 [Clostridioides difficile]
MPKIIFLLLPIGIKLVGGRIIAINIDKNEDIHTISIKIHILFDKYCFILTNLFFRKICIKNQNNNLIRAETIWTIESIKIYSFECISSPYRGLFIKRKLSPITIG